MIGYSSKNDGLYAKAVASRMDGALAHSTSLTLDAVVKGIHHVSGYMVHSGCRRGAMELCNLDAITLVHSVSFSLLHPGLTAREDSTSMDVIVKGIHHVPGYMMHP